MHGKTIYLERQAIKPGGRVTKQLVVALVNALKLPLSIVAEPIDEDESGHGVLVGHFQAPAQDLEVEGCWDLWLRAALKWRGRGDA
jgi:hypothetical protein